jgi:ATP-dependent helicase/nuclease subunit A
LPSETAFGLAGRIHHILVDEFQDTSRRQHELLRRLIAAWPDRDGRSCFVVGDPMQSIYFFRDADAELFPRVRAVGLEIPGAEPLLFDPVQLKENFRTTGSLVKKLNSVLSSVFAENDGSGVTFSEAIPARNDLLANAPDFKLHLRFSTQELENSGPDASENSAADKPQVNEIVELVRSHMDRVEQARQAGATYRIAIIGRTRSALAPIAEALRQASIPFRAVDLEKLSARPEVLDTIALARALLNPCDRVAWLGVLRAPWCGLSLRDLHALTSGDDPTVAARPVPELLAERISHLSPDGQRAATRLVEALEDVPQIRFTRPSNSTGTRLRNVWQRLGGEQCVDAAARANLDLLWQSLDKLPNAERDLPGPALIAALDKLTARPDPAADSECGVQLMTIHKSKGLEFEVVILPELQAATRKGQSGMLSWLERGLPPGEGTDDSEDVTEFLVAPLQSKGTERSNAKTWVDRVYTKRESQEMRRLLYVAATRARDELHLFAQPVCKRDSSGEWQLTTRSDSLLSTAWPGLKEEIEERFAEWKHNISAEEQGDAAVDSIAAAVESDLLVMPTVQIPTLIRRLPPAFRIAASELQPSLSDPTVVGMSNVELYERHEGGLLTRALGIAVHSLLEHAAHLRSSHGWDETRAALSELLARTTSQIRSAGVDRRQASELAKQALNIATRATSDVNGQWILSPHNDAVSETRWAGIVKGSVRSVQVDRAFRAGESPLSEGTDCWWFVDYKTAYADSPGEGDVRTVLPHLRALFAPQINAYAEVLHKLHGESARIHAGLYYPRMMLFDWWEA